MPVAEIIAIGTELLLGEIQDTNTCYLARALRGIGVDLFRTTIIGDNEERIAQVVKEAIQRAQIVITCGGIGPTVDDPTRQAVAKALGVDSIFLPELWEQIQDRFKKYGRVPTENNRRQAYIPSGAIPVKNEVGTAPAFYYENPNYFLVSLPGVPRELEFLMENEIIPHLKSRFNLEGIIKTYVLHTAGVGESQVDEWISDLETQTNPTVGLLAHPGQVDIRITAKATSSREADSMIRDLFSVLKQRLGTALYGVNETTLEQVLVDNLLNKGLKLAIVESGLGEKLSDRFNIIDDRFIQISDPTINLENLKGITLKQHRELKTDLTLGMLLEKTLDRFNISLVVITPNEIKEATRSYGGPQENAPKWAINIAFDYLRRVLLEIS